MTIALFSFRFWPLISIPAALLAAHGYYTLTQKITSTSGRRIALLLVLAGLILTSGTAKYAVNTATWYPDATFVRHGQLDEHLQTGNSAGYLHLSTLPSSTVTYACNHEFYYPNAFIIATGHKNCFWCADEQARVDSYFNTTAPDILSTLRAQGITYMLIDGLCTETHPLEEVQRLANDLVTSGARVEHQSSGVIILSTS